MADSPLTPAHDGLSDLFGAAATEVQETSASTPSSPATPATPVQYGSRRAMREALAGKAIPAIPAPAAVVVPATPVVTAAPATVVIPVVPAASASAFDSLISEPAAAAPVEPAVSPAEVWTQLASTVPSADAAATSFGPSRRELRTRVTPPRLSEPQAAYVARTVSPAGARPRKAPAAAYKPKKRASALVTMMAVVGLFASAALPAYAFGTQNTDEANYAESKLADDTAALTVPLDSVAASAKRGSFEATSSTDLYAQRSDSQKSANYEAYMKSGALAAGDDYPWFSELSNNQGGGLSPLNYFYRECVDFVAWRLNVDAGSTSAPFKYVWSDLTPNGGNAYQWKSAWENHGWATGTTPKKGAVAWFGYHVGYVSAVNSDGTVLIEEYNHQSDHLYGQRTIPATDVTLYLYAPPR